MEQKTEHFELLQNTTLLFHSLDFTVEVKCINNSLWKILVFKASF